jgi:hypothetical protein
MVWTFLTPFVVHVLVHVAVDDPPLEKIFEKALTRLLQADMLRTSYVS